jgi:hypothetical protein
MNRRRRKLRRRPQISFCAFDPASLRRSAACKGWPKLLVVEDAGSARSIDLFSHLTATGYAITARSKQNVIFRLESTPS